MAYVPVPNQSVSGTVGASVIGLTPVSVSNFPTNPSISGTVAVSNFPLTQNVSGSVAATITNNPTVLQLAGSILAVSATVNTGNSSVQVLNFPANQSVSGAVSVSNFPTTQNVSGSVAATQGTNPWTVVSSIAGGIFPVSGSVAAVITNNPTFLQLAGSILATSATVNTGNSSVQVLNFPTNQNVSGSVISFMGGAWSASVGGTVSVLGTVPVTESGTWIVSIAGGTTVNVSGSVVASGFPTTQNVSGSVVAFGFPTNQNVSGSVVAFQGTVPWQSSVWFATPGTPIRYSGSITSTSVTLIQASAAGKKSYITDFWAANTGAATTLLTFKDGSTSILGQTIVPSSGGSNSPGITVPLVTTTAAQDLVFQTGSATSVLYLTVNGYQI